jgi:soluble lytic murein transglycosylase-like protein
MNGTAKTRMKQYESLIHTAAILNRIDVALIKAVIHAESAGNPRAVSRAGAMGLMQLMPGTARDLGVRPFVAGENIEGGSRHLARLIKTFGGNLVHAIAAYNAGEETVKRYGGIPPYSETKTYVRRVLALKAESEMRTWQLTQLS